jgi:hypothetical protein
MDIPVGRLLYVDMGQDKWGKVIYMVINPPIICEHCNSVVFEWKSSEDYIICPDCENVIEKREYYPCPKCGKQDYMTLRVVNNNNWHYDSVTGEVTEYNDKSGFVINVCKKELEKEISQQKIKLLSSKESVDIKRKILWTSQDDYESGKPIPDWIKEKFPY